MGNKEIHLGLRLLGAIREAGYTQNSIAQLVETNPNHISRLVRSEDRLLNAKGQLLYALADTLNVSVDWLLGRTDERNQISEVDDEEKDLMAAAAHLVSA